MKAEKVKSGRAGGSAAKGEKKRRRMKGMKIGRGSAGHAKRHVEERQPRPDSFDDVRLACLRFLRASGERCGGFREVIRREARESMSQ